MRVERRRITTCTFWSGQHARYVGGGDGSIITQPQPCDGDLPVARLHAREQSVVRIRVELDVQGVRQLQAVQGNLPQPTLSRRREERREVERIGLAPL